MQPDPDATRAFTDAHPQPEPTEYADAIVVRQARLEDGTIVAQVGTRADLANWTPTRPQQPKPVRPAPVEVTLNGGANVQRSRELDSDGNPVRTTIRLGG